MTQRWFIRKQKRQGKGVQGGDETRCKDSGTEKETESRAGGHREEQEKTERPDGLDMSRGGIWNG